jgi:hypothetical protein
MVAQEFYTGRPASGIGPWVTWDGDNEDDVVEWLNNHQVEWAAEVWTHYVADDRLVIVGDRSGEQPPIDVGTWVKIRYPEGGPNRLDTVSLAEQQEAGMWSTQDPLGRPPSVDYLIAPEEGPVNLPD